MTEETMEKRCPICNTVLIEVNYRNGLFCTKCEHPWKHEYVQGYWMGWSKAKEKKERS